MFIDTVINNVHEDILATKISTIDSVKEYCARKHNIDPKIKSDFNRRIWHEVKMQKKDQIFKSITNSLRDRYYDFVFIISRELEEIDRYKKHYYWSRTVYVDNLNLSMNEIPDNGGDRDAACKTYDYDFIVKNDMTISCMQQEVLDFMYLFDIPYKDYIRSHHNIETISK